MKKLFSTILVICSLLGGNAYADNHIITIQCKNDDPDLSIFRPIYVINLETKKVEVGATYMQVVKYSEKEILLGKSNAGVSEMMQIDRLTGRYSSEQTFWGKSEEEKKIIISTGYCIKIKKAF
tara:strand:- start:147 stop:515 length:369 start_codon:yes stop_codon:yes gene_type:complete